MKKFIIASTLSLALSTSAFASPSNQDMQQIFGKQDLALNVSPLSNQEMVDTDGEIAPLIAVGFLHAGRFIVQRYVSKRVATAIVKRGGNVLVKNRQQANAIAKAAGNGRKGIREYHNNSSRVQYSHYHTSSHGRGHVLYGSPR